jgi:hypothetical protein
MPFADNLALVEIERRYTRAILEPGDNDQSPRSARSRQPQQSAPACSGRDAAKNRNESRTPEQPGFHLNNRCSPEQSAFT